MPNHKLDFFLNYTHVISNNCNSDFRYIYIYIIFFFLNKPNLDSFIAKERKYFEKIEMIY